MSQSDEKAGQEPPKNIREIAGQLMLKYTEMSATDPPRFKNAVEELKVKAKSGNKYSELTKKPH